MKEIYERLRAELLSSCVPFWLTHGWDKEYGGLQNCLDREGRVYSSDKSIWMQGRCGWTFSYLYRHIEKRQEFLDIARSCIAFATRYGIDPADGRMYFTVTRDGRPLRKRRYWFSETFYIMANAEYYMATGETPYLDTARRYFDLVYGMYRDPATDPYKITPKGIAATRDTKALANPMILLNVASIMREADAGRSEAYTAIIDGLIADIRAFHKPEHRAMMETVRAEDNGVILDASSGRVVNPGHDIECAWFVLEEGIHRGDGELRAFAETVFLDAFERGWDKEYGGILYFRDLLGLPVEAYEHDMKLWWPHNEAAIASLMLYRETGNEKYREIFLRVLDYAFTHFSDPAHGEWFGYLRRDGKPTEPPCKGHTYKGPFHVMRMLAKCLLLLRDMI